MKNGGGGASVPLVSPSSGVTVGGGASPGPSADWLSRKAPVILPVLNIAAGSYDDFSLTPYRNTDWVQAIVGGNVSFTGFTAPSDATHNRFFQLTLFNFNAITDTITLVPLSGSSSAGNRIVTPNREPLVLKRYESAWLWHNGNEWIVLDVAQDSATVAAQALADAAAAQNTATSAQTDATQALGDAAAAQATADAAGALAAAAVPQVRELVCVLPLEIDNGPNADLSTDRQFTILAATQAAPGSFSAADKLKLDSLYPVAKLDNTNAWDALWLFEGNLNDSSGNARTQAVGVGTARYGKFGSRYGNTDLQSLALGLNNCQLIATIAALRTAGDVTLALLLRPHYASASQNGILFGCTGVGTTQAMNHQYLVRLILGSSVGTEPHQYGWRGENGAGAVADFTLASVYPGPGDPLLMHWVRESNVITAYLNGALVETSGVITAPDGGTTTDITIGGAGVSNNCCPFDCASAAIKLSALNAAAVLADAKHVFGVT